jgi:hypothetical protein
MRLNLVIKTLCNISRRCWSVRFFKKFDQYFFPCLPEHNQIHFQLFSSRWGLGRLPAAHHDRVNYFSLVFVLYGRGHLNEFFSCFNLPDGPGIRLSALMTIAGTLSGLVQLAFLLSVNTSPISSIGGKGCDSLK